MKIENRVSRLADEDSLRLQVLGLMTAGIAHDLGNLIQLLSSVIRSMDRSVKSGEVSTIQPLLVSALGGVDRATALTRRLVGFAGHETQSVGPVMAGSAIRAMEDLIRWTAGPMVTLRMKTPELGPTIYCDRRDLENAVLNLVINARDAMPAGGSLEVSAARDSAEPSEELAGSCLVVRVADTGCGMAPSVLERVFEPFFTTKGPGSGTGLGLPMVQAFVARLNGAISIESVPHAGTTVTLRLPLKPDELTTEAGMSGWH